MTFKITKKGSNNFWHTYNNNSKVVNLSDFEVVLDYASQTFCISMPNGANVPNIAVAVADIIVLDETGANVNEIFANVEALRVRLVALGYTPYIISSGGGIQSIQEGTNITVDNTDPLNPIVSATGGGGGSQTLAETLVLGNTTGGENIAISDGDGVFMDNGSRLIKGVTDAGTGGAKGIALKCSIDYEYKWEAGRLYVLEQNGFTIRETKYNFTFTPTVNDDSTKGFIVGSRWILDNGNLYVCTDASTGSAVWELQTAVIPDATTSVKGILKLAGDLGGTSDLPTVPDLVNKVDKNTAITGATKTKITYDAKGLITSGDDATTADIGDSTNKRYVTDAQQTVIGNTSGINTGDETGSTIRTKLGITTLSGSNTGDQDLSGLQPYAVASFVTGISFDVPKIYFNFLAPTSGTLTSSLIGAKRGVVQKIYVNHATNPVSGLSGWVLIGSGTYTPSVANIIYAEWTDNARVEYWIVRA